MTDVRSTLDRLIRERGCNYASISRLLGRNAAYIQQFIRRGSPRTLDQRDCELLSRFFGVDPSILGGSEQQSRIQSDLVQVPVLDVEASAGHGSIADHEARCSHFGFEERWLRQMTASKANNLSIIRVLGDSMEPTLSDGDDVMVDQADGHARLRDGIYVLRMDDALNVKRIAIEPQGRRISVVSDNKAYPSWRGLERRSVDVVGRVLWFGRQLQ
ncbi:peptidase S24 [Novosphingobium sp. PC22D]|uniref:S24 family peptidase n=1 Tax=Novosphingobium sp. PC22D TaxID=1962403 RepID=UPI000BEFDF9C|nr:S24 family peptidase [Novosphingobium sp. PC22D]PEQ10780.1 peptidase S24 [Novosphingobium sp. PC22D]